MLCGVSVSDSPRGGAHSAHSLRETRWRSIGHLLRSADSSSASQWTGALKCRESELDYKNPLLQKSWESGGRGLLHTPKPKEIPTVQKQGRHSRGSSKPCSGILIPLWQFSLKIHHKSGSDFPLKLYSISTIHISSILPLPLHCGGDFAVTISQGRHLLHLKTVQLHC